MSTVVLTVGPDHTLRQVAHLMSGRHVGSAIVHDPDGEGLGILTERDILNAVGGGLDADEEKAANHITWDVVYAGPTWTLHEAAAAMLRGGFRHLVVVDSDEIMGIISVRDIVRAWAADRTAAAV